MAIATTHWKKVWKWAALGYIMTLHLLVAVLVVKTDFIPRVMVRLGIAEVPNLHYQNMLRYHLGMDESVPDGGVIFLGDSITQALATAAVAPYATNYGIGMENTAELLAAIPHYKSLTRANAIVLTMGINDFAQGRTEGLHDRYQSIVAKLPPGPTLIWNSVMPAKTEDINSSDILEANRTIQNLCRARPHCVFVDTWSFLTDTSGQMI